MYTGRYQAHRGVSSEYPENTLIAFKAAIYQGYDVIELDPEVTKDGTVIVFHDRDTARTLREHNGKPLEVRPIRDIPYSELINYDAGAYVAEKFHSTKVPTLEEALLSTGNTKIKIDNKIFSPWFGEENTEKVFDVVKRCNAEKRVAWTCQTVEAVKRVLSLFPHSEIDYDGNPSEESLKEVAGLCSPENNLIIWLPVENKNTWWMEKGLLNDKSAETVHKYGKLGLWILSEESELDIAEKYGADIIETAGTLKPLNRIGGFVDCHIHSNHSHDSKTSPEEITRTAKELGLAGYTLTDHFDLGDSFWRDDIDSLTASYSYSKSIGFDSKPFAMAGIEIGEGPKDTEYYRRLTKNNSYDIINGSCHFCAVPGISEFTISRIDFRPYTQEQIDEVFETYLRNVASVIDYVPEINVVCHLTYPLRYICIKCGRTLDLDKFRYGIDTVLKLTIKHNLALEINTSGIDTDKPDILFPNLDILKRYYDMGGRKITLGSDAHVPSRIAKGFGKVWEELKKIGFNRLYYFREGIAVPYVPD